MFTYAVVEIAGRQYKVEPGRELEVNFLGEAKTLTCDKVLMLVNGDKVEIGRPYLKELLQFEVVSSKRGRKIRVATYHAKANTRRVKGARIYTSTVKLAEEKKAKKEGK